MIIETITNIHPAYFGKSASSKAAIQPSVPNSVVARNGMVTKMTTNIQLPNEPVNT